MTNELETKESINMPAEVLPHPVQVGDRNTLVAHADHVTINNHIYQNNPNAVTGNNTLSIIESTPTAISEIALNSDPAEMVEREYYNLIVTTEEINNGKTTILRNRSLKTDIDIVKQLSDFSKTSRARLMTFPSLIMNENTEYAGRTDAEQQAFYGFITDIKIHDNGKIMIKFNCKATIPQQAINKIIDQLDISGGMAIMELNHTHWTVKNVDLMEELTEAGLLPVKEDP